MLKALRIAALNGTPWEEELLRFLTAYRSTPHSVTGKSWFETICGRPLRTKLPFVPTESLDEAERDVEWSRKLSDQTFRRNQSASHDSQLRVGDQVLVRAHDLPNRVAAPYQPQPATVLSRDDDEVSVQRADGSVVRHHCSHVKPYLDQLRHNDDNVPENVGGDVPPERPRWERRTPTYLQEYSLK